MGVSMSSDIDTMSYLELSKLYADSIRNFSCVVESRIQHDCLTVEESESLKMKKLRDIYLKMINHPDHPNHSSFTKASFSHARVMHHRV